jgi:hypothetical protein
MRVDVDLGHRNVEAELAALYARLRLRAEAMQPVPAYAPRAPELVFHCREIDGEFHVYAEDPARNVLAGCTVFNRVFELDAEVGRFVRSPHSRYAPAYQRKGVATAVYQWALQAGMSLVSGPRQSVGAYRLWEALGRSWELVVVSLEGRDLRVIAEGMEREALEVFDTRMMLVGTGWARSLRPSVIPGPPPVIPAKAGSQGSQKERSVTPPSPSP